LNRSAWIIIFSVLLAATGGIVALVVVANRGADVPVNVEKNPQPKSPAETKVSDEYVLRLEVRLGSSEPKTRIGAILELAGIAENDPERLGPMVFKAINDKDPMVRFLAVRNLGTIKYTPAAPGLTNALDDPDQAVSVQAIESLVKLDKVGLQAVMGGLGENRIKNINAALLAVGRISGQSFALGEKGRQEALEYWTKQNKQERLKTESGL
jgi:hypothetical protein